MKQIVNKVTNSYEETIAVAKEFAKTIKSGDFVAFFAEMGAGKTVFVRGIAQRFKLEEMVCSPTFSIVNEYPYEGEKKLVHCDLYRIRNEQELYEIGFFDYLKDENVLMLAEWSEKIVEFLPKNYFKVKIEIVSENMRKILIERQSENEDFSN